MRQHCQFLILGSSQMGLWIINALQWLLFSYFLVVWTPKLQKMYNLTEEFEEILFHAVSPIFVTKLTEKCLVEQVVLKPWDKKCVSNCKKTGRSFKSLYYKDTQFTKHFDLVYTTQKY